MSGWNMTKYKAGDRFKSLLFFGLLLLLWQVLAYLGADVFGWWKSYTFPTPAGACESFVRMTKNGSIFMAALQSVKRAALGFLISLCAGTLLGLLITNISFLNRNMKPLLLGIQTLPSICWVPFAILWFGLRESAILFVVVMGSVFSLALSVEHAIKNIPPIYVKAARTMGASGRELYLHVILPAALPGLVAGLRQGWSFAWRALMSAEVMSAVAGLGYTLNMGRDMADINQVMAVMILIIAIGILIDQYLFNALEIRILRKRGLLN